MSIVCRLWGCTAIFRGICSPWAAAAMAQRLRGLPPGFCCGTTRDEPAKGDELFGFSPGFFDRQVTQASPALSKMSDCPSARRIMPGGSPRMQQRRDPTERERVRHGEHVIEHLLAARRFRRGRGRDRRLPASSGSSTAIQHLLNYESDPDDVDQLIGTPGYVSITARGEFLPATGHQRRPPALAVPDDALAASAPGEDDALLAQPLRHRLHEDRRRVGARRRRATWRPSRPKIPTGVEGQIELFRQYALGNFRDLLVAVGEGPGDARVARRPHEREGAGRRRTSPAS